MWSNSDRKGPWEVSSPVYSFLHADAEYGDGSLVLKFSRGWLYKRQYMQDKTITSFLTLLSLLTHLKELGFHHETKTNLFSFSHFSLGLLFFPNNFPFQQLLLLVCEKKKKRFQIIENTVSMEHVQ